MKFLIALTLLGTALVSGCTTVVMQETVTNVQPVIVHSKVVIQPQAPYCYGHETPVYGYADVYRDGQTHVRLREVAYVDHQWRCQ